MFSTGNAEDSTSSRSSGGSIGRRRYLYSDISSEDAGSVPSAPSRERAYPTVSQPSPVDNYPRSQSGSRHCSPERCLQGVFSPVPPRLAWPADGLTVGERPLLLTGLERPPGEGPPTPRLGPKSLGQPLPPAMTGELRRALSEIALSPMAKPAGAGDTAATSRTGLVTPGSSGSGNQEPHCGEWGAPASHPPSGSQRWRVLTPSRRSSNGALQAADWSPEAPRRARAAGRVYGPERFYYDASTFTGVHRHGGPSIMDKGGVSMFSHLSEMTRPNLRLGGTFVSSQGKPLTQLPKAFLTISSTLYTSGLDPWTIEEASRSGHWRMEEMPASRPRSRCSSRPPSRPRSRRASARCGSESRLLQP